MSRRYLFLKKQTFKKIPFSLVPIRHEDRWDIMNWRNDQMYHLRQSSKLSRNDQERYFESVVRPLFDKTQPTQVLFSYLDGDVCCGYGGLVHIDWSQKTGEVSFIMDTALEKDAFELHWSTFLELLDEVAFEELEFTKISTYAYDLRPHLYPVLENAGYKQETRLKDECTHEGKPIDVVLHSKTITTYRSQS